MREIKFRAWDSRNKAMRQVRKLHIDTDGSLHIMPMGYTFFLEGSELELMQYTGLKDKNGVGIYEGDIVKFRYYQRYVTGKVREMSAHGLLIGLHFYWMITQKDTLEVIGNTYENPELVKDE